MPSSWGPWTDRDTAQYEVAGLLLAIRVLLWAITWFLNRALRAQRTYIRDVEEIDTHRHED